MRLPNPVSATEWIDREKPLEFSFEGRRYTGYAGDTISSALIANGVRVLGRSFKYHRPRGVLSFANHDVNALFQEGGEPNIRGDVTPLKPGMNLTGVNTFGGGLEGDYGRCLGLLSRFLPVGFYYKAFHTKALFPLWEKLFRFTTGLGKVDFKTPRLRTPKAYDFCDVLVIGAGPSGLAAALAAAEAGADVVLVDENAHPGGSGLYQLGGEAARAQPVVERLAQLGTHRNLRVMLSTCAVGYYKDHWVALVDAEKMVKMRAQSVVLASGAFEQPAVFRNNDLPGVMLASAAQRLLHRYSVLPVKQPVVLTANGDGYRAALDWLVAGAKIAALVDLRGQHAETMLEAQVRAHGVPVHAASAVIEALPGAGGKSVRAVRVAPFVNEEVDFSRPGMEIACDGVLMSVGWAPAANLAYQAGTQMNYDATLAQFVPETLPEGLFLCGKLKGVHALQARLLDGERAGSAAAAQAGFGAAKRIELPAELEAPSHPWPIIKHPKGKNFVDFDEDVQFKDIAHAVQEGFDNIELLKRYSTFGMGPSQGKHTNMNVLRILAKLTGKTPGEVGTTTARPMVQPTLMSHLAGRGFSPQRRTPMHSRHEALGAVWMNAGLWQRPEYYRAAGLTREACIQAEVAAVRSRLGLIDVSTLGKLEIKGKDAAEFLERVYVSRYAKLPVGMTRYAVMCDETGVIIDDGVVARLADDHFYFTTTTSGAATIYRELSRLNALWKRDVVLVNHTGSYAAVNLAGPNARAALSGLTELNLSGAAFPYLGVREGKVAGIAARLMRVGFVGEWGYEIHVPANNGCALWDMIMAVGKVHGIRPFGVEAQRLLRLEKGHVIIGQDSDGLSTPFDLGMQWAVKMDKPFFIGQRSLAIVGAKPAKQRLVGLVFPEEARENMPKECNLVIDNGDIAGRVTSIAFSPTLNRTVALAFVRPEQAREGARVQIRLSNGVMVEASVAATPFYDPDNLKQKEAL